MCARPTRATKSPAAARGPISISRRSLRRPRPPAAMRCIPATVFSARMSPWRGAAPRRASPSSGRRRRRWSCSATRPRPRRSPGAAACPIIEGTEGPTTLEEARAFLAAHGAVMIKAIAGGGGRGMRIVDDPAKLDEAYARCQSEAMAAFGSGDVYVERLIRKARHIEVQIVGDRHGAISHLWERECTIQRRQPEAHRGRAEPVAQRGAARRASSRPPSSSRPPRTTTISAPSNSWSMTRPAATTSASPSSRPIRGCRSSIPSPRKCSASTWCGRSLRSPTAPRSARSGWRSPMCQNRAAMPCSFASTWRPWTRPARRSRPAARCRCSTCRPGPACASIPLAIPATGPAPPSTRCSPR